MPLKDNDNQSEPSLVWAIKTAFNNYQIMIDKYEQLLLEISTLNTSVTEKLGELNTKLEKIPDKYVLMNLDGKLSKQELEDKISLNTSKLAKRQNTFNKSQFTEKTSNIIENLNSDIIKYFSL